MLSASTSGKASGAQQNAGMDAQSVPIRLKKELATLMMTPTPNISAFLETDSLTQWTATISSTKGGIYDAFTFKLSMRFGPDYPYKPPRVTFTNPCWHPNVDFASGEICIDILKEKWSPIYSVTTILLSIQALLEDPNPDSPLNVDAATLWRAGDKEAYKKKVHQYSRASLTQQ